MNLDRRHFCILTAASLAACSGSKGNPTENPAGGVNNSEEAAAEIYEVYSDRFFDYLLKSEEFEVLGTGYGWSEGPAWDKQNNRLYFTDVPGNKAYRWSAKSGVKVFLNPSGAKDTTGFREAGANGLLYTESGDILVCNHGKRAVQSLDPITKKRTTLTRKYRGKKFNSPNDLIRAADGSIYFTDPPYGLEGLDQSPLKEMDFNGVYRLAPDGKVTALIKDMTFPNGIALSPDGKTLYVAQSDPDAPHLYTLDLTKPKRPKKLFVDFKTYMGEDFPGLPDGMVVDIHGNIFATGPGGVFLITPAGEVLGRILTGKGSANCTFGEHGSTLFITNHDRLIKLKTQTTGL